MPGVIPQQVGVFDDEDADLFSWKPGTSVKVIDHHRGSNVDLGTPEDVVLAIDGKLADIDGLLAWSAEVHQRLGEAEDMYARAKGEELAKMGEWRQDRWYWFKEYKSASSREQVIEMNLRAIIGECKAAKRAVESATRAANLYQSQLEGVRSIGARIGGQMINDGRM